MFVFQDNKAITKTNHTLDFSDVQIGSFEHNLTTDLLNHLVFLQKVFMKEVNEVIQKVSGIVPETKTTFLCYSYLTSFTEYKMKSTHTEPVQNDILFYISYSVISVQFPLGSMKLISS